MSQRALANRPGARNMSAGVRKGMSKLRESARACSDGETMVGWSRGPLVALKRPGCLDPTLLIWLCCRNLGPRNCCCCTPWEVTTMELKARRRRVKWNRPIALRWAADTEVEMEAACICHLTHNGIPSSLLPYSSLQSCALLTVTYMYHLQHTPVRPWPGYQKSNKTKPGFSFLKSKERWNFLWNPHCSFFSNCWVDYFSPPSTF